MVPRGGPRSHLSKVVMDLGPWTRAVAGVLAAKDSKKTIDGERMNAKVGNPSAVGCRGHEEGARTQGHVRRGEGARIPDELREERKRRARERREKRE